MMLLQHGLGDWLTPEGCHTLWHYLL